MAAEHWFRWHHGTVTDPKWRIVASRASHALSRNVTVGHALSVWCAMLECASQANPRGTLVGWCDEDVSVALGIDEQEVAAIRGAMQGKTLDGECIAAWDSRQIKRIDESAADRKAAQRERDRQKEESVTKRDNEDSHAASRNVTHGSRTVTVETETETETETEKDQELRLTPLRVADEARHAVNGFQAIIDSYHEALPNCLRITVLNPKRKRRLAAVRKLAKQVCESQGWPYDEPIFFAAYWAKCAEDPWMRGEVANPNNPRWKQNLDVLLAEDRFANVMDRAIESMRGSA